MGHLYTVLIYPSSRSFPFLVNGVLRLHLFLKNNMFQCGKSVENDKNLKSTKQGPGIPCQSDTLSRA
jgi:hypothetical protein